MMRRSDSISSVSSMASDDAETMHIFVKNVSGDSSKCLGIPCSEFGMPQRPSQ